MFQLVLSPASNPGTLNNLHIQRNGDIEVVFNGCLFAHYKSKCVICRCSVCVYQNIIILTATYEKWQWLSKRISRYEAAETYLCFGRYCNFDIYRWNVKCNWWKRPFRWEHFKFVPFSRTILSYKSRTVMHKPGCVLGLPVETVAREGTLKRFCWNLIGNCNRRYSSGWMEGSCVKNITRYGNYRISPWKLLGFTNAVPHAWLCVLSIVWVWWVEELITNFKKGENEHDARSRFHSFWSLSFYILDFRLCCK